MKVVQEQDDLLAGSVLQLSEGSRGVHRGGASPGNKERGARTSAADVSRCSRPGPTAGAPGPPLTFLGRLFRLGKQWS